MPAPPRPIALALALALLAAPAGAEAPSVVASIKPVESLTAAVMAGVGTPELLVPGNASPHTYAMRPSDARRLGEARLVVWVGPIYEAFLAKPLAALAGSATILTLSEAPGVRVLPLRNSGAWEEDPHHHDHPAGAGA